MQDVISSIAFGSGTAITDTRNRGESDEDFLNRTLDNITYSGKDLIQTKIGAEKVQTQRASGPESDASLKSRHHDAVFAEAGL